jgi:hypothetical protein
MITEGREDGVGEDICMIIVFEVSEDTDWLFTILLA